MRSGTQTTTDTLADYEAWLRSWASDRTVEARVGIARGRLAEWGLDGFTPEAIQAWLARPGLSRWTRSTYHAHLRDLCSWLVASGRLDRDPMGLVRSVRQPRSQPRPLSEADAARVLAAAVGITRDWILLALNAGLRAHEIAKLRGEDVTEEMIYVVGKGGDPAEVPTHPDLWAMAQRYPRVGWWFPADNETGHVRSNTVSTRVGGLFHGLGIAGSIHRCRHTYGTRLLRAGVNIRTVQQLMRHASLHTTAAYTAVDGVELREGILRLPAQHLHAGADALSADSPQEVRKTSPVANGCE